MTADEAADLVGRSGRTVRAWLRETYGLVQPGQWHLDDQMVEALQRRFP